MNQDKRRILRNTFLLLLASALAIWAHQRFAPQLAKLGDVAPSGPQWIHEVKWDGYRLVATIVGDAVRLWSRNAIEWTQKVPELRAALA